MSTPTRPNRNRTTLRPYKPATGQVDLSTRKPIQPISGRPIDANVVPLRAELVTEQRQSEQRPPVNWRVWLHRTWITLKVLAVVAAIAAVGTVIYLIVLAVMAFIAFMIVVVAWIHAHLLVIGVVIAALFFFGGGSAVCAGIHCGGCGG